MQQQFVNSQYSLVRSWLIRVKIYSSTLKSRLYKQSVYLFCFIFRYKQSLTPKNTTQCSNTSVFLENSICLDDNIRQSLESSNKEFDSVNNNQLTIENALIEKPVYSTLDTAEQSCFKSDENDFTDSNYQKNTKDFEAKKINSSFIYFQSEASVDKSASNFEQTKSIEKTYEETSSFTNDNSSHTSNQVVKPQKVCLKVIDQEGRERKFRVVVKQKMKKLV